MRRRELLSAAAAAFCGGALAASAQAQEPVRAWVGATLWLGDGQILQGASLIVTGERISALGKGVAVPANAQVVQAHGLIITPGWVAVETPLGLMEIELEQGTVDAAPRAPDRPDAIRAAYSAADGFNPLSSLLGVARREGVTQAVATPHGGLISGTSAFVELVDQFPGRAILREDVALHANLFELSDSSRPHALGRLREALESARLYQRSPQAYDQGQTRDLPFSVLELRRLTQVLGGTLPLVVRVARAADMLRLLELSQTYQLRLILSGAEEAWLVAAQLAAARVPVIIDPSDNLPHDFSGLNTRRENAALLGAAGVPVIFSSFNAYAVHNLRQLAGIAVGAGTSRGVALRALSFEPARAFGMGNEYGVLAVGRVASFSVWTGDPFELGTWASEVVLRGRSLSLRSRQTALFERYRELGRVPRGRAGLPPARP